MRPGVVSASVGPYPRFRYNILARFHAPPACVRALDESPLQASNQ